MGWLGNNFLNTEQGGTGYVRDIFTSNGTWSCCTGASRINVIVVGGGGGGHSSLYTNNFGGGYRANTGGGGGAGGDIEICDLYSGFGSSQCVIIGTGGASNTAGTDSCFGALVVAGGGAIGEGTQFYGNGANPGSATALGGAGGTNACSGGNSFACADDFGSPSGYACQNDGLPGTSARGKAPSGGGGGSVSTYDGGATQYCGNGGAGGPKQIWAGVILGPGGAGADSVPLQSGSGSAAQGYGAGGGGAANISISGGACFLGCGGAGSQGVVIVTQFF